MPNGARFEVEAGNLTLPKELRRRANIQGALIVHQGCTHALGLPLRVVLVGWRG